LLAAVGRRVMAKVDFREEMVGRHCGCRRSGSWSGVSEQLGQPDEIVGGLGEGDCEPFFSSLPDGTFG
jgi:hypothetical protein